MYFELPTVFARGLGQNNVENQIQTLLVELGRLRRHYLTNSYSTSTSKAKSAVTHFTLIVKTAVFNKTSATLWYSIYVMSPVRPRPYIIFIENFSRNQLNLESFADPNTQYTFSVICETHFLVAFNIILYINILLHTYKMLYVKFQSLNSDGGTLLKSHINLLDFTNRF